MRIHILALLVVFQGFVACQQGLEQPNPLAANVAFQSVDNGQQQPEQAHTTADKLLYKSNDGGQTWQDASAGLNEVLFAYNLSLIGGEVYLQTEDYGLYHKSAASEAPTWQKEFYLNQAISHISPGKTGPYLTSNVSGFFQETIPGTGIWSPVFPEMKDKTVYTILESREGNIFVGCKSGIFKSADSGKNWKAVYTGSEVYNIVAADGVLIGGGEGGLLRSTDGGEHWDWVLTDVGVGSRVEYIDGRFVAIARTFRFKEDNTSRLYNSADGGKTWQRMGESLPTNQPIFEIKQAGKYIFCSQKSGILRSSDWGKTWELMLPASDKSYYDLGVFGSTIFALRTAEGC